MSSPVQGQQYAQCPDAHQKRGNSVIAEAKPGDLSSLTRLLGERHAERFGDAFLEVLREAG